jgi:hypothetical protein
MLLRKPEVQYVADMPLGNVTVDQCAALAALGGARSRQLNTSGERRSGRTI